MDSENASESDSEMNAPLPMPEPAEGGAPLSRYILPILGRLLFVVFVTALMLNLFIFSAPPDPITGQVDYDYGKVVFTALIAAAVALGIVFFEWRFQRHYARELVAVVFGVAAGLVVSTLVILVCVVFFMADVSLELVTSGEAFARAFMQVRPMVPFIVLACIYLGAAIVLQTRNDFRFLIPYVDFSSRGTQEGGLLLDTSAVIDGRIADICDTRLIAVPVVIPDFVLRELQTLADSSDRMKRMRGRRGLDIVARLQKLEDARVSIRSTDAPVPCETDRELVRCAKEIAARIVTTDFNLNKISQIEGVTVINVNDIANALKPAVIPGENIRLKVLRQGQEPNQGVGYLDDGTMIVVENGRPFIGETISAVVTGTIQTSAGRMIFVRPDPNAPAPSPARPAPGKGV